MAEAATNETLTFLVKLVQESLEECRYFWETMEEQPKLLELVEFSGQSMISIDTAEDAYYCIS